jgi:cupin fold WbuC family metalloprotein
MIRKVCSLKKPTRVLNIIYRPEITKGKLKKIERMSLTEEINSIQAMHIKLPKGTEIEQHKHKAVKRVTFRTNEGLLVLKGKVELSIFDTDKGLIEKVMLYPGDITILIDGGHSFKVLQHASVFEFKNGPYLGSKRDKVNF